MENEATMGHVLPFARSADYLRKLAVKQRALGKPVQALEMLRLSQRKAPRDVQTTIELAETYAGMQCPTLSNRALFTLLKDDDVAADCFYGAGCNFYMMRMADCARDCLVMYLQKRPDGKFASEAVDMIETVDADLRMESTIETRLNRRIERVLDSLDAGKPRLAARQVRRALALERRNSGVHALLAFAMLGADNAKGALSAARHAMRCCRDDIRALCAMAAALKANGAAQAAEAFLQRAIDRIENDEDAQLVCQTACEMGEHGFVHSVLLKLEAETPFSDELLHLLASACHNIGQRDEAIRRWKLLRRIDPMDSIAEYRLRLAEENLLPEVIPYQRQVTLEETLERLSRLRVWVQEGGKALWKRWENGDELERLLRWGLTSPEPGVPQAMVGVLSTIGDEKARTVLRDLLCDVASADSLKHTALAALCVMDAKGPFYALIGGRLTLVHVSKADPKVSDPHLDALIRAVKKRLEPLTEEEDAQVASLCRFAVKQAGAMSTAFRARGVELAVRWMRGEKVSLSVRPVLRRKLERYSRRIMKEARQDGMHQL